MNLELQIQSLSISFTYGLFLSLTYNLLYFLLYYKNKIMKIIFNIIFTLLNVLLYFNIMLLINNGSIHIYFLIILIVGFFVGNAKTRSIRITK